MNENPLHALCGAHCRTTGQPCQNYQMPNGRCRMHGGKSTGRPVTTGYYTQGAVRQRSQLRQINQEIGDLLKALRKSKT